MDVLLQRLGRLHRHSDRPRPDGFASPAPALVLVPTERDLTSLIRQSGQSRGEALGDHGFGTVYEDLRVLEATWQELERRTLLTIPEDNRELVEAATHPEALKRITDALGAPWQLHATKTVGARLANQGIAVLNTANWGEEFGTQASLFPDRTQEPRISTRLGEEDRKMNFDPPFIGPFGSPVEVLALPAQFSKEASSDAKPTDLIPMPSGGAAFTFGPRRFVYDRLGLRPESSAPHSPEDDNADA
ncbi:helicase Cas3 [compost metagenome]